MILPAVQSETLVTTETQLDGGFLSDSYKADIVVA